MNKNRIGIAIIGSIVLFLILSILTITIIPLARHTVLSRTNPYYFNKPTPTELLTWVYNNITYRTDPSSHGREEAYQSPEETLRARIGDCEDFAILYASLIEYHYHYKLTFAIIEVQNKENHMVLYVPEEDKIIDPTSCIVCLKTEYPGRVIEYSSYNEIMSYATSLDRFVN
jgi:hypothetical protein